MNDRRAPKDTQFGTMVSRLLTARHMRQTELAQVIGKSVSYVNATLIGAKAASPELADTVADALGATQSQRTVLHRAAALDSGFRLDLALPAEKKKSTDPG